MKAHMVWLFVLKHPFPATLMALYIGASISYGMSGDWKRALYWVCAFELTVSVTI